MSSGLRIPIKNDFKLWLGYLKIIRLHCGCMFNHIQIASIQYKWFGRIRDEVIEHASILVEWESTRENVDS